MKLEFAPGSRWNYSNTGYVVLGHPVRKASGQFYGDVLRDRVFGPLGMKTARIITEEDIVPHRAAGYRLERGELKNQEWVCAEAEHDGGWIVVFVTRRHDRVGRRAPGAAAC